MYQTQAVANWLNSNSSINIQDIVSPSNVFLNNVIPFGCEYKRIENKSILNILDAGPTSKIEKFFKENKAITFNIETLKNIYVNVSFELNNCYMLKKPLMGLGNVDYVVGINHKDQKELQIEKGTNINDIYLKNGVFFFKSTNYPDFNVFLYKKDNNSLKIVTFGGNLDTFTQGTVHAYCITNQKESKSAMLSKYFTIGLSHTDDPQCFKVEGTTGGARSLINPKAKKMHKIDLTTPKADVFIIGKYAHPRAPFIVIPAMQSWIHKNTITFPKPKLVLQRKGNTLFVKTGNTYDVFEIKHIAKMNKYQRGGSPGDISMVVEGDSTNTMCLAKETVYTKTKSLGTKIFFKSDSDTDEIYFDKSILWKNDTNIPFKSKASIGINFNSIQTIKVYSHNDTPIFAIEMS
jgi:hypothetical protein